MNKPSLGTAGASGGAAAAIVTLIVWLTSLCQITIPADVGAALGTLIGTLIHWYISKTPAPATVSASDAPTSSTASALLVVALLGGSILGLSACARQSAPWTPGQTAMVELTIATAVENVAANVEKTPGLSPADVADIQAGAKAAGQAIQAAAASLTGGGDASQQAVSAAVSAVTSAAGNLGSILTAKHGANVDPRVALMTAGETGLQRLPSVIAIIVQVNGGWLPTQTDLDKAGANFAAAITAASGS